MKLIPLFFFMALFIGFFIIYTFQNDYHIIVKNKNTKCLPGSNNCYN